MKLERPSPDALQIRLKELFDYEIHTGNFVRKIKMGKGNIGEIAGAFDETTGYIRIRVDGVKYAAHRLAFVYMLGRWPIDESDHKDGVKHFNAWDNLREVTHAENMKNRKLNELTVSGLKGVSLRGNKWRAKICVNKKQINLGTFNTSEEASSAYYAAAKIHFGEFAREECNE